MHFPLEPQPLSEEDPYPAYLAWCRGATPVRTLSGQVPIHPEQAEAMCRLLIDEGHMTPVAQMQLRKLWQNSTENGTVVP